MGRAIFIYRLLKKQCPKSYWYVFLFANRRESNQACMKQVTGASGFLGSHIVYQLLEKGYYVKAWA